MTSNRESQNPIDLDDLYRDVILDHYRSPRNRGAREDATISAEGFNPSCGDEIQLSVAIVDHTLSGLGFGGSGCSISQSSASMMTEALTGRSLESAREMSRHVQQMLTDDTFDLDAVDLGDLEALSGVAKFPVRIKCGLLAWKVLDQALANASGEALNDDSDIPTRVTSG
ncbi:MAG: SUF system NifU family Fe-S cluster assembly protein [Chloroflexi bacterium]|nr:SUF system NifU family Fe-S cluster assembly protein [Chloroflexota bacterium]MYC02197.1 SUF system NifU family Fe-S cluster assembly protein [Chloroflexota bacterium]MYD74140.1 SUF system NifU family Fe-S cluster assembly protein [Chloroflexota bacterium]